MTVNVTRRILGYWNVRGLAQPIRLLLEYTGLEFEETRYHFDMCDPSDASKMVGPWMEDKNTNPLIAGGLGEVKMEFANLPYCIEYRADGTVIKMTQTIAILRHLARTTGLVADGSVEEEAMSDLYQETMLDLGKSFGKYCYSAPGSEGANLESYLTQLKSHLQSWDDHFSHGTNQWVLLNDKLTYLDFLFFEILDTQIALQKDILEAYSHLMAFHERFRSLEPVKAYLASSKCIKWPIMSPFAKTFGFYR